jgi:hypothetical protein
MAKNKLKISFIVTTRNDNHGLNLNKRTKLFLDNWINNVKKNKFKYELIIVEWNNIKKKKNFFFNFLNKKKYKKLPIKIITVPNKFHNILENSDKIGLYQMIAKNVGARRASGEYLLFTNIDILFSTSILKQINEINSKNKKIFYRAIRYDVSLNYNKSLNLNSLEKFVVKINYKNNTKIIGKSSLYYFKLYLKQKIKLLINFKLYKFMFYCFLNNKIFQVIKIYNNKSIFNNACGDFQLIKKENFFQLDGYYEYQGYSWNIDTLLMWQAYLKGFKFKTLDGKIFHMNHSDGSGFNYGSKNLFERLKKSKIFYIDNFQLYKLIFKLKEKKLNDENWGFKNADFPTKKL